MLRSTSQQEEDCRLRPNPKKMNGTICWNISHKDSDNSLLNSDIKHVITPYEREMLPLTITSILIGIFGIIENAFLIQATRRRMHFEGSTTDIAKRKRALVFYFVYNLALSDILAAAAANFIPLQFYVDVFHQAWSCRLMRFSGFIFPAITMQLVLVIAVERHSGPSIPIAEHWNF